MTYALLVPVEGDITEIGITAEAIPDAVEVAVAEAAGRSDTVEPWTARNLPPRFDALGPVLVWAQEWGLVADDAQHLKVNPRAWWFYGRSPIIGPAAISLDSNERLPVDLVAYLREPLGPEREAQLRSARSDPQFARWQGRWWS